MVLSGRPQRKKRLSAPCVWTEQMLYDVCLDVQFRMNCRKLTAPACSNGKGGKGARPCPRGGGGGGVQMSCRLLCTTLLMLIFWRKVTEFLEVLSETVDKGRADRMQDRGLWFRACLDFNLATMHCTGPTIKHVSLIQHESRKPRPGFSLLPVSACHCTLGTVACATAACVMDIAVSI